MLVAVLVHCLEIPGLAAVQIDVDGHIVACVQGLFQDVIRAGEAVGLGHVQAVDIQLGLVDNLERGLARGDRDGLVVGLLKLAAVLEQHGHIGVDARQVEAVVEAGARALGVEVIQAGGRVIRDRDVEGRGAVLLERGGQHVLAVAVGARLAVIQGVDVLAGLVDEVHAVVLGGDRRGVGRVGHRDLLGGLVPGTGRVIECLQRTHMHQRAAGRGDVRRLIGAVVRQHILLDAVHGQLGRADRDLDGLAVFDHGNDTVGRVPAQGTAHGLDHAAQRQHGIAAVVERGLAALGVNGLGCAIDGHGGAVNGQDDGPGGVRRLRRCRRDGRERGQQHSCAEQKCAQAFSQFHLDSSFIFGRAFLPPSYQKSPDRYGRGILPRWIIRRPCRRRPDLLQPEQSSCSRWCRRRRARLLCHPQRRTADRSSRHRRAHRHR